MRANASNQLPLPNSSAGLSSVGLNSPRSAHGVHRGPPCRLGPPIGGRVGGPPDFPRLVQRTMVRRVAAAPSRGQRRRVVRPAARENESRSPCVKGTRPRSVPSVSTAWPAPDADCTECEGAALSAQDAAARPSRLARADAHSCRVGAMPPGVTAVLPPFRRSFLPPVGQRMRVERLDASGNFGNNWRLFLRRCGPPAGLRAAGAPRRCRGGCRMHGGARRLSVGRGRGIGSGS